MVNVTEKGIPETAITEITSKDELRATLGGFPSGRAATKDRPALHPLQIEWLRRSPFCVLATSDADGNCDASPRATRPGSSFTCLTPAPWQSPNAPATSAPTGTSTS